MGTRVDRRRAAIMDQHDVTLADALQRAFRDLPPIESLYRVGEGFGSSVLEVEAGGTFMFRLGRHTASAQGYERERRLLPALAPHVPLAIPGPRWYTPPSPDFPFGALGYLKIAGTSLHPVHLTASTRPRLIDGIARFLVALHAFPTGEAMALGIPLWDAQGEAREQEANALALLRERLTPVEWACVAAWLHEFQRDPVMGDSRSRLIHGDLWHENVLVNRDGTALEGIIDFESARVGDIAQDFATLRYLGDDFAAAVLQAYIRRGGQPGLNIAQRIERFWEYRERPALVHLWQIGDTVEFEASIRKLRSGPILCNV